MAGNCKRSCHFAGMAIGLVFVCFIVNLALWYILHMLPAYWCYSYIDFQKEGYLTACLGFGQHYIIYSILVVMVMFIIVALPCTIYNCLYTTKTVDHRRSDHSGRDIIMVFFIFLLICIPSIPYQFVAMKFCKPGGIVSTWKWRVPVNILQLNETQYHFMKTNISDPIAHNNDTDICFNYGYRMGYMKPYGSMPVLATMTKKSHMEMIVSHAKKYNPTVTCWQAEHPISDSSDCAIQFPEQIDEPPQVGVICQAVAQTNYPVCSYVATSIYLVALTEICLLGYTTFIAGRKRSKSTKKET